MGRRVSAIVALLVSLAAPASAAAVVSGISDQQSALFGDPRFLALHLEHVRLVVPWDAALTEPATVDRWLAGARAAGATPLVAFEHARSSACPGRPCPLPAERAYAAAFDAFRARYPWVTEFTPWNEPNHASQPTAGDPAAAAGYYNILRARCPRCTLVAGDVLDAGDMTGWLARYRAALAAQPGIWGLHDYYDTTYFQTGGLDRLLALMPGQVWLTETGGIVRFAPPGGGGLPYDEQRAAASIRFLYDALAARPRVARAYLYQWMSSPGADFDAGLVAPDGRARPGLAALERALGLDGLAPPGGSGPARQGARRPPARAALGGRRPRLVRGLLVAPVRCGAGDLRCVGTLTMRGASVRVPRLSKGFDIAPGGAESLHFRLPRAAWRRGSLALRLELRQLGAPRAVSERVVVRGGHR